MKATGNVEVVGEVMNAVVDVVGYIRTSRPSWTGRYNCFQAEKSMDRDACYVNIRTIRTTSREPCCMSACESLLLLVSKMSLGLGAEDKTLTDRSGESAD